MATNHRCYRCTTLEEGEYQGEEAMLETIETTSAENGDQVFFTSGYSAREIALKHAKETDGKVYVNNLSRKIRRPDLTVPVAYAVARSAVFTLRGPDQWHGSVYRAYWPPLS
jgi:hypothetical protein